jgi:small multidrug resistance pump
MPAVSLGCHHACERTAAFVPLVKWVLLALAIVFEVTATLALRASEGFTKLGYVAVVVVGSFFFGDPFTPLMGLGIVLIMGGVLLVEVGSSANHS